MYQPVYAASFSIGNGEVSTAPQSLNDNESGTIAAGGQLNVSGAVALVVSGDNAGFTNGGAVTTDLSVLVTGGGSDNATIVNDGSMTTSGTARTVVLQGNNHQFTNNGTITAPALASEAVYFLNGSGHTFTNNGSVSSSRDDPNGLAFRVEIPNATLVNTGTISSSGYFAVGANNLAAGFQITNSGMLSSAGANDHTVSLGAAASVVNRSGGSISASGGGAIALNLGNNAVYSVTNAGSISAASSAETAIAEGAGAGTLVLQPGSSISGLVDFGSGTDTLELGGIGSASLDAALIGTQFLNFDAFRKAGSSTWTLSGSNASALTWRIDAGTLQVDGSLANTAVAVNSGGTLGGSGTVADLNVTGGTVAPGPDNGAATLNTGALVLDAASALDFELGAPGTVGGGVNDLIAVTGNLTLDGTLSLGDLGGVGTGSYTLITYTGALTDYGLSVAPLAGQNLTLDTTVPNEVRLTVVTNSYNLSYSAGADGTLSGNVSQVVAHGGSGTAVEAVPEASHVFTGWSDGSLANPRTDTGVTAPVTVTAQFALAQYLLSYGAGPNGSLSGNTAQYVTHGGAGSAVEAVPDSGYRFAGWSDGSNQNPRLESTVTGPLSVTALFDIPPIDTPIATPLVIDGPYANTAVIGDASVTVNGTLEGGKINGLIENKGVVRNVTLLPGGEIHGGRIEGSINGPSGSPAPVNAFIGADALVSWVRLGPDTAIDPGAAFGAGVCFESAKSIPEGFDLGRLLEKAGASRSHTSYLLDHAVVCGSESLLQAMVTMEPFASWEAVMQDTDDGRLSLRAPDFLARLWPVSVSQGSGSFVPGWSINGDGDARFVTIEGQIVVGWPSLQEAGIVDEVFLEHQLRLEPGPRGNLVLEPLADISQASAHYFTGRPDVVAVNLVTDTAPGLYLQPQQGLKKLPQALLLFEDEGGISYSQQLLPVPVDWFALREYLLAVPGAESASLSALGVVRLKLLDGRLLRGRANYRVDKGAMPRSGQLELLATTDRNGDGVTDLLVLYPNGDRQILYRLP